ncbi:MAG: hypothetical protein IJT16_05070 [Lachnospiraceae bacterium]|nr:hypothetical protein [Lachnospiraceae bacterium]
MKKKKKMNISVEVASSDHSDFEVTEIYLRLVSDNFAEYLVSKKRYVAKQSKAGLVLLPPYRLEYDNVITFSLGKFLLFHILKQEGIRL